MLWYLCLIGFNKGSDLFSSVVGGWGVSGLGWQLFCHFVASNYLIEWGGMFGEQWSGGLKG